MHKITIGNLRNKDTTGLRCDRSSVLGNPFEMKTEDQRNPACDAFGQYFDLVVGGVEPADAVKYMAQTIRLKVGRAWKAPTRDQFMVELKQIEEIARESPCTLLCWCNPKRCHVETIVNYLRSLVWTH